MKYLQDQLSKQLSHGVIIQEETCGIVPHTKGDRDDESSYISNVDLQSYSHKVFWVSALTAQSTCWRTSVFVFLCSGAQTAFTFNKMTLGCSSRDTTTHLRSWSNDRKSINHPTQNSVIVLCLVVKAKYCLDTGDAIGTLPSFTHHTVPGKLLCKYMLQSILWMYISCWSATDHKTTTNRVLWLICQSS